MAERCFVGMLLGQTPNIFYARGKKLTRLLHTLHPLYNGVDPDWRCRRGGALFVSRLLLFEALHWDELALEASPSFELSVVQHFATPWSISERAIIDWYIRSSRFHTTPGAQQKGVSDER